MSKECANCMHKALDVLDEPCLSCKDYSAWEPKEQKEDKMENENTTTKIEEACIEIQLKEAQEKIKEEERYIRKQELELAQKYGMIDGLKFALRCNGISGADVR